MRYRVLVLIGVVIAAVFLSLSPVGADDGSNGNGNKGNDNGENPKGKAEIVIQMQNSTWDITVDGAKLPNGTWRWTGRHLSNLSPIRLTTNVAFEIAFSEGTLQAQSVQEVYPVYGFTVTDGQVWSDSPIFDSTPTFEYDTSQYPVTYDENASQPQHYFYLTSFQFTTDNVTDVPAGDMLHGTLILTASKTGSDDEDHGDDDGGEKHDHD